MDRLYYTYQANSNKLLSVAQGPDATQGGFTDGNTVGNDYSYDGNGNLKEDKNKGISNIIYNHLNLPSHITFASGKIEYFYDAVGTKQKKIVTEATGTTTTIYSGNYIYQNNALQMISQPEGYLEPNVQGGYDYGYRLKDHLGNIRLTFVDFDHNGSIALSEITEENNYYPFGLKHQGYNFVVSSNVNAVATKFKYNGKELNDELNLDWYDYGARFYDPTGVHFTTIDPYAESYYSLTPYGYCAGNPVKNIDVNGKFIGTIIGTVVGAATGAYDSYKKGGDVWAGATEGAVSGAIAGAAVDLVVAATIATGGGALVVIGAGAAAGAVGGAVGAVAGDATGQVVSSVNKGNSVSDAVSNISTANMADKAKTGAITGTIGGTVGAGVAKGLQAVTKATYAIQSTMAKSITEVSKALPAADGATINGVQKTIERGIEALGKSTSSTVTKTSVSTGMATESAIQVGQRIKEDEKP